MVRIFLFSLLLASSVYANDEAMVIVCKEMKIVPASKAVVQWQRVFGSEIRKEKYGIDQLSPEVQEHLKVYLVQHAADSSQPMVPGL